MKVKTVKDRLKSKASSVKAKVKGIKAKVKGKFGKCCALVAALVFAQAFYGCATADPASRSNDNRVGDIRPSVEVVMKNASSNTVSITTTITLGDGLMASADSKGSTETQTATPTLDIRPDIDVKYNDAIAGATDASKSVLSALGAGIDAVIELMASKKSGTVDVVKKDGSKATVKCEGGQCSFCEDCELK